MLALKFYKSLKEENLKPQWLIKIKRRNIQIQYAKYNMCHAYCFSLNPVWKKMRFQLALNKTLCPASQLLTHRRLKHQQKTKINKTMFSGSSSPVFHTIFTISDLKSK